MIVKVTELSHSAKAKKIRIYLLIFFLCIMHSWPVQVFDFHFIA